MIIVTGGTGFIGSNLIARLEKDGYTNIICVDYFGSGTKWKNVRSRIHVRFVRPQDMFSFIDENVADIKAIVHLGAISSTTESDVDRLVENNIQLTIKLFDISTTNSIPFIYASSASVYGNGDKGFSDVEDIHYLSELTPLNPYAWSKLSVDRYVVKQLQKNDYKSQIVGLRFFNVYGPNEYHKNGQYSVIYKFYLELKKNRVVNLFKSNNQLFADGEQLRDFVYVGDCVDVIAWMVSHPLISGIFNVGSGQARTFNDVARLTIKASNTDTKIQYIEMPSKLCQHYQNYTQAEMTKLRSVGYDRNMTTIEEGVQKYINDYLNIKTNNFEYEPNYL